MTMKINFLMISILLFACNTSQATPEQVLTVPQQLESDHDNEKLTDDEYFTYLTYSIFAQLGQGMPHPSYAKSSGLTQL